MRGRIKVEGLKELQTALGQLRRAAAKGVLRRVLTKRGQLIAADAKGRVRIDEGDLRDGIGVGTKLTARQGRLHKRQSPVEVFVGAPGLPQAITEEFGTVDQAAHPYLRPAWDANKTAVLDGIADDLGAEIAKSVKRMRKPKPR